MLPTHEIVRWQIIFFFFFFTLRNIFDSAEIHLEINDNRTEIYKKIYNLLLDS